MNILVLGNGFDLAHGLPTKYADFLDWIVAEVEFWEDLKKQGSDIANRMKVLPLKMNIPKEKRRKKQITSRINHQVELWECINENVWLEYFLQCDMYGKENWIDFESEIGKVIKTIEEDMKKGSGKDNVVKRIRLSFFDMFFIENMDEKEQARDEEGYKSIADKKWDASKAAEYMEKYREEHPVKREKEIITYANLIRRLECDLDRLIRALEIYFCEYVSIIEVKLFAPSIKKLSIDRVLSFNYTNTYENIYGTGKIIGYDYIHGEANINNTIETNNMVLGIDEYLSDDKKDKDIEFIAFKKFYQRIYKGTGCEYKEWVEQISTEYKEYKERKQEAIEKSRMYVQDDMHRVMYQLEAKEIKNEKCIMHNLYIFGHSLDVTDGDILRDLILHDNVHTTIFYYNKDVMGQQIANLVKVIGQDELIKRTGGSTKTIEFKLQQDMVERNA